MSEKKAKFDMENIYRNMGYFFQIFVFIFRFPETLTYSKINMQILTFKFHH